MQKIQNQCEWCNISHEIWEHITRGEQYPWVVEPFARQQLSAFLENHQYQAVFIANNPAIINLNLRNIISPHLTGPDRGHATDLARWIVRDWGGIRGGPLATINDWSDQLGDYNAVTVNNFIQGIGNYRVSSWSKLLAFADHENHAIYDARTSVGLNCALSTLGDARRFFMPANRGPMQAAQVCLRQNPNVQLRHYENYLVLLNCFVEHAEVAEDFLSAEMSIFANAPIIAQEFAANHQAI